MRILFEGKYYSGVGTIIFTHVVTAPHWRQVMEHKRALTPIIVDKELTCIAFSQHTGVSPLVLRPASSIDGPRELRFSQLFLLRGSNYLNGRVWILIEGGYYSTCRYYSRKYGISVPPSLQIAHIRGNHCMDCCHYSRISCWFTQSVPLLV